MSDFQAIADRVEIETLRSDSIDAQMMDDYDRYASLFTPDGVWRVPAVNAAFTGREEIRAGIKRLKEELWDYLVQTTHPGAIQLDGDTASGRAYVLTFGRFRDGGSHLNYSAYHDRYRGPRTAGCSPSGSTKSCTSTPPRWLARPPRPLNGTHRPASAPARPARGPSRSAPDPKTDERSDTGRTAVN
jgi:uncharacterized protein (TIGR02246 family)